VENEFSTPKEQRLYNLSLEDLKFLLNKYDEYYNAFAMKPDNEADFPKILNLLKLEQTFTNVIECQGQVTDINSHMPLLERFCDHPIFIDIALLSVNKWNERDPSQWNLFFKLLKPYLEFAYARHMKIWDLNSDNLQETIKMLLEQLNENIKSTGIKASIEQECTDLKRRISELENLKSCLVKPENVRDENFYNLLGEISLLIHIYKFLDQQDLTLLKTIIVSSIYIGTILSLFLSF